MRLILLIISCGLASMCDTQAQILFGTTNEGGKDGAGTIIKYIPATDTLVEVKAFEGHAAHPQYTKFVQASDGKLYGTTSSGGSNNGGVIFSFDPANDTYTKLKDFDFVSGNFPTGSLIQARDGKLYGLTDGGGVGKGVIFSFHPTTSTYTKLQDFDGSNGSHPYGSLVQATDGKLYGMTINGGSHDNGVIFSFDPSTSGYAKLKDFDGIEGGNPYGSLVQAADGKLFGMTAYGGTGGGPVGKGVIFSFDPATAIYKKLKDFKETDGVFPRGTLMQADNGTLYGMTKLGGRADKGTIFSYNPASSVFKKLHDFDTINGSSPGERLLQAADGKLYGLAAQRGIAGGGVIFSFHLSTSTYTRLKDFDSVDRKNLSYPNESGAFPMGALMQASNGKLYGMTTYGGTSGYGVVFSFTPAGLIYKKLKDFGSNETGSILSGGVIQAGNGKLYGSTAYGGSRNQGVLFSYDPSSSTFKKLMDFEHLNGKNPNGSLFEASNGRLYGVTRAGGTRDMGVLFTFNPTSLTYAKLKNFGGGNGNYPNGSLIQATDGKLYGITNQGGTSNAGVIFSLDPSNGLFKKLKDLDFTIGAHPEGGLVQGGDGKLYGTTTHGGSENYGVVFSFDPSTLNFKMLKIFTEYEGFPRGTLVQASDGKLYGITHGDDESAGLGSIFSFDPVSSAYTKLKDFNEATGYGSQGSLLQASDGKLYGVTLYGGSNHYGVIFSYDPSTSLYTKLKDLDSNYRTLLNAPFVEVRGCIAGTPYYRDADGDGFGDGAMSVTGCPVPNGYVANNKDCDDNAGSGGTIHPGAHEICNGIDDDCDANIDSWNVEAEKGVLHGAVVTNVHTGFTGNGYVDFESRAGNYLEVSIDAAAAGPFSLEFRYTNGGTANRPLQLMVNGVVVVSAVDFAPTGSWATWRSVKTIDINLNTGVNKVRLITINSQGPNVDHVTIAINACAPGILEAEQAALHGAVVAANQTDFTGTGFADYQNASGDYIEWTTGPLSAGSYALQFRYANGSGADRPLKLEVNGMIVKANLAFPPTGDWGNWSVSSAKANLIKGINTIRLTTAGFNGPNVDHLAYSVDNSLQPVQKAVISLERSSPLLPGILKVDVSPNPAENGRATVVLSASSNLPVHIRLVDMAGRIYQTFQITPKHTDIFTLPVNDLPSGIYILDVQQGNINTHTRLVVGRK